MLNLYSVMCGHQNRLEHIAVASNSVEQRPVLTWTEVTELVSSGESVQSERGNLRLCRQSQYDRRPIDTYQLIARSI
jgi:hypothetical protein